MKMIVDWAAVLLFLAGVTLIALGLWQVSSALALIFLGVACIYLAFCVSRALEKSGKESRK